MIILAIGVLAVTGMQITSLNGNYFSNSLTQASYLAQDRIEFLRNKPITDSTLDAGSHNDGTATISGTVFNRSYAVSINGNLRTITYTVTWNDRVDHSINFRTIRSQ